MGFFMRRSQLDAILKDLKSKMVILVGPRQSGKTWLAKEVAKYYNMPLYLNYDSRSGRDIMKSEGWLPKTDLLILDELHKMPEWKNYLKGVFDTKSSGMHILVRSTSKSAQQTMHKYSSLIMKCTTSACAL